MGASVSVFLYVCVARVCVRVCMYVCVCARASYNIQHMCQCHDTTVNSVAVT